MKTLIHLFFTVLLCLIVQMVSAHILVVNNITPTPAGTYATIQLAHDAASPGDTLMLTPTETDYVGITVTKWVFIIGNGWGRPSNLLPNTHTSGFIINSGAAGTFISGCEVKGTITINTNNICIKRNKCNRILINSGCANISIIQNFIISAINGGDQSASVVTVNENTSFSLLNNIISNTAGLGYANPNITLYPYGLTVKYPSNCIIANNIIRAQYNTCILNTNNGYITQSFFNNIILDGSVGGIIGSNNNLCNSTQLPATDGNVQNVDINSLFVDLANNDFHLKSGSPAIGAGYNGTDCGIYGGELGFVDKGIPGLPYIYYLDVPGVANKKDGLNVTVKAKSGN